MAESPRQPTIGRFDTEAAPANAAGPQGPDIPAGSPIGEYLVEGKIGEGGMGTVYLVTHPLIGKKAAIKVMNAQLCHDASAVERFMLEARSVNQIGHPNIVDVFAFGKLADGRSYFIMEFLQGENLASRVARSPLSLREGVDILSQIADALEAAHEKEVVHRDLKPENIFLVPLRGKRVLVKLLDFGIAKLVGTLNGVRKTRTGQFVGTPGYMSPEQARGKQVSSATDVYALGVTAFEMFTGELPFVADNPFDIVHMHLNTAPPSLREKRPDVPEEIDAVVRGMMAKEPADRPTLHLVSEMITGWREDLLHASGRYSAVGAPTTSPGGAAHTTPAPGMMTPVPGMMTPAPGMMTPAPGMMTPVPGIATPSPGSISQISPVRSNRALILGAAACVLLGVLGTRLYHHKPAPSAVTPAHKEAVVAVAPPIVQPKPLPAAAPPAVKLKAWLLVRANVDKASFTLDGKAIGEGTAEVRLDVAEDGDHLVSVTAPKRAPYSTMVHVERGQLVEVNAKLERVGGPQPAKPAEKSRSKDYVLDPFGH